MDFNKNFKIFTTIIFAFSLLVFSFPASAQKVLQCAPGTATVNSNLQVGTNVNPGDLTVSRDATITNKLTINGDIYAASGSQKIYLGSNPASPYISNNLLNSGEGILFYSNGGDDFLWQSPSGTAPDAMILKAGGGLPNDNNYNLQVFGQVSPYQLHTQIIHLDSQGLGGTSPNVLKLTMAGQTDNGGALFHNGSDSLVLGALNADGSLGSDLLAVNTASGNTTIKGLITSSGTPVCLQNGNGCPPVALTGAGTTDRLARWTTGSNIGDSVIQDNGANIGIGGAPTGDKLNVSGNAKVDGDIRWTGTLQGGAVPWARLTSFPAACSSGQYVEGIGGALTCKQVAWSEVGAKPLPGACILGQKLAWDGSSFSCAPDIDTDTDTQDLSIAGNVISLTDGGAITLPLAAVDTLNTVTTNGSATGNSVSVGGLNVNKPCALGFARSGNTCIATHGNEYLIREFTNTGAQPSVNAWQSISIPILIGTTAKIAIIKGFCGEDYMYIRKTGSSDAVKGFNTKDTNIICLADNNNTDYLSNRLSYFVELNSNMEFDWRNDPTDAPTLTAGVYLIGYLEN